MNSTTRGEATSADGTESIARALTSTLPPAGASDLRRLHEQLESAAQDSSALDLVYTTVDSPIGELLLAASNHGMIRVAFAREDFDEVLATLASKVSPRLMRSRNRLSDAAEQLEEYFAGSRRRFELPLDLSLSSPFRRQVQSHLATIGYGSTESYAEVARIVGNPRAVRAVGSACSTNPLPLILPCHRVLRSDGKVGGYRGGAEAKSMLLTMEAS